MEKMLNILIKHRMNFSVEHFANHAKVRVRRSGCWSNSAVFGDSWYKELALEGFAHTGFRVLSGDTPTAVIEYTI